MTTQTKEKSTNTEVSGKPGVPDSKTPPFVTLWQDETGVIQIKLGNDLTPVSAIALLELGLFRYKANLLPAISPRPAQAPKDSEPPQEIPAKN